MDEGYVVANKPFKKSPRHSLGFRAVSYILTNSGTLLKHKQKYHLFTYVWQVHIYIEGVTMNF